MPLRRVPAVTVSDTGARVAIRLLQDAAERGEIDPWDVDVIAVVDGFLDQLRARIEVPRLVAAASGAGQGGSYEQDLAETSEAFLAASVLVGLKAEVLEALIRGCKKVPGQAGYFRAIAGFREASTRVFDDSVARLPGSTQKLLKEPEMQKKLAVQRRSFESTYCKRVELLRKQSGGAMKAKLDQLE